MGKVKIIIYFCGLLFLFSSAMKQKECYYSVNNFLNLLPRELHEELLKYGAYPEVDFGSLHAVLKQPGIIRNPEYINKYFYDGNCNKLLTISQDVRNRNLITKQQLNSGEYNDLQNRDVAIIRPSSHENVSWIIFPTIITIWDLSNFQAIFRVMDGHYIGIFAKLFDGTQNRLFIDKFGSNGIEIYTCDQENESIKKSFLKAGESFGNKEIKNILFDAEKNYLLSTHTNGSLNLWDLNTNCLRLFAKNLGIQNVAWDPEQDELFFSCLYYIIQRCNIKSKTSTLIGKGHKTAIQKFIFDKKTNQLLSYSLDIVKLWDLKNNTCIAQLEKPCEHVTNLQWDPINNFIFFSNSYFLKIFNLTKKTLINVITKKFGNFFAYIPGNNQINSDIPSGYLLISTNNKLIIFDLSIQRNIFTTSYTLKPWELLYDDKNKRLICLRNNIISLQEIENKELKNSMLGWNGFNIRYLFAKFKESCLSRSKIDLLEAEELKNIYEQLPEAIRNLCTRYVKINYKKQKLA